MFSKGRVVREDFIDVRDYVTDVELLRYYLNIRKIPCLIKSPLRPDKHPSFRLYSPDGKNVYFKDFSTGDSGGVFKLLKRLWNCDYRSVFEQIKKDFLLNNNTENPQWVRPDFDEFEISKPNDIKLECRKREWRDYDIEYWKSYGINKEWLDYAEVYPVSHKIIIKNNIKYCFAAEKYAYVFVEHKDNNTSLKLYQPFSKTFKWLNKHDASVLSLWTKVPERGEKIVICSSLKDALCFWINTGIPAIAPQSEGNNISATAQKELKRRYNKIYILFDNDEPGIKDAEKLSLATGFTNIVLPKFPEGKDVSDLYKSKGKDEFLSIIKNLLLE